MLAAAMIHDPAATSAKLPGARRRLAPGLAAALLLAAAQPALAAAPAGSPPAAAGAEESPAPKRPSTAPTAASKATGAPLIDPADRPAASRLDVEADLTPPVVPPPAGAEDEPGDQPAAPPAASWAVTAHGRFITLPSFVLDTIYKDHPSFQSVSAGAAVEYGDPRRASWVFELDWTRIGFAGANWRENGVPPGAATYADVGLHMLSLDASYRWAFRVAGPLDFVVGLGLGLGGLMGDIKTVEVLPNCVEPIDQCPHWREASRATADLPTRVIPILHVALGAQVALGDDGLLRLMLGFRDALYVGLSAGLRL